MQPCKVQGAEEDGSEMVCRMPVVNLPDDLRRQLEQSESGTIDNTGGPGVARYWASDATARVDIYVGLQLDGFEPYQNITDFDPSIKMQFALRPVIICQSDVITVESNKDSTITIKV